MKSKERLSELLEELKEYYGTIPDARQHFMQAEETGLHITPCHFYSPVPDVLSLKKEIWKTQSCLVGVDMRESEQLTLLEDIFSKYTEVFATFPLHKTDNDLEFTFDNDQISGADPFALYAFVKERKPARIIEVGSGFSTLVTARAIRENNVGAVTCIEPYPRDFLDRAVAGIGEVKRQPVQETGIETFNVLEAGDMLFIDSTHVSRLGSDVNYLMLEVLPRLKPGVLVHIHDIFMPYDYPETWTRDFNFFWNEQYLVQAFLSGNRNFEVRFCVSYMGLHHLKAMQQTFPGYQRGLGGGSLWIERV